MNYSHVRVVQSSFARTAAGVALMLLTVAMGVTAARAASLGKLEIVSGVGEPFRGRIEVLGATRHELDTLGARLASPEWYGQAGLSYAPALERLRFNLAKLPGGRHYIKVTSSAPFNEPVVDLVVELAWFGGATSYAYTALVDPAGSETSPSVSSPSAAMHTSTVAALGHKKTPKRHSTAKSAGTGDKQAVGPDSALTERIRSKEEKAEQDKHRLAAAQERIVELQRTVQEQEQLLTAMAANAIVNDMRAADAPAITRVSHETTTLKRVTAAPEPAAISSETMYLAGGAAVTLLALVALMRARRRRVGDIGGEYSRLAPTLQPAV